MSPRNRRRNHIGLTDLATTGSKADYEQAIVDFTEAIRLHSGAIDCHYGRAQACRAIGEHARAAADDAIVAERLVGAKGFHS